MQDDDKNSGNNSGTQRPQKDDRSSQQKQVQSGNQDDSLSGKQETGRRDNDSNSQYDILYNLDGRAS